MGKKRKLLLFVKMNSNAIICLEFSGNWFDYSVSALSSTEKSIDSSGLQISTRNHCFDWEQRYYSFKSLQYVFRTFHLVVREQTVASLFPTIIYTEYLPSTIRHVLPREIPLQRALFDQWLKIETKTNCWAVVIITELSGTRSRQKRSVKQGMREQTFLEITFLEITWNSNAFN